MGCEVDLAIRSLEPTVMFISEKISSNNSNAFMIRDDVWMQGIVSSAIAYYIQGVVMKEKGPVFASAFNPLSMIIIAILSSFIFAEELYLGR